MANAITIAACIDAMRPIMIESLICLTDRPNYDRGEGVIALNPLQFLKPTVNLLRGL